MATADSANLVQTPEEYSEEVARARKLAERYRVEFVDMEEFRIDQELFRSIPADLMLRYGFVPHRRDGKSLIIVVSDPTDLPMIDELGRFQGFVGSGRDLTEKRRSEAEITRLALFDGLTGLANRQRMRASLDKTLAPQSGHAITSL